MRACTVYCMCVRAYVCIQYVYRYPVCVRACVNVCVCARARARMEFYVCVCVRVRACACVSGVCENNI